jgi:tetratricopeptide (TPR) repeat protein
MLNLKAGNMPEANAYFNILRKRYPNDENIPLINFYWGEHYFEKGDYQKAAQEYQNSSSAIRRAATARGLHGHGQIPGEAGTISGGLQIADYIEKRWPRYYIGIPSAFAHKRRDRLPARGYKKAKDNYLTAYNNDPNAEGTDLVLARLGDIASRLHRTRNRWSFYELAVPVP